LLLFAFNRSDDAHPFIRQGYDLAVKQICVNRFVNGRLLRTHLNEEKLRVAANLKLSSELAQNARTPGKCLGMVKENIFISHRYDVIVKNTGIIASGFCSANTVPCASS